MNYRKLSVSLLVAISILSVAALSCSMAANLPNPFASATPTATATFTPTQTPTITPSPTSTPTATPAPTGVAVRPQGDGTTYVHDWDNQYELSLPANWLAVPLTKEDIDPIVKEIATDSPEFARMAEWYQSLDSSIFRVFGLSKDPKYAKASYPTLLMISAVPDTLASTLPMEAVTAMIEDKVLTGSTDTTWSVKHNAHGVDVGIVEGSIKMSTPNAGKQNARTKVIAFQSNKKLVMVQFFVPTQFAAQVLPALDSVIDTIQLDQ